MRYYAKIENGKVSNLVNSENSGLPEGIDGVYVEYTLNKNVSIGIDYNESEGFTDIIQIPAKPQDGKTYLLENNIWVLVE
jgi:hypothetical protein